jgi:hypothetical protein
MAEEVVGEILWTNTAKTSFNKITRIPANRMDRKGSGKVCQTNRRSPFEFNALSGDVPAFCQKEKCTDWYYQ